jgi:hypothetical protein
MSHKNCIEVKVTVDAKGINTRRHSGRAQVVQQVLKGERVNIQYKSKILKKMLESVGCEVRDGVTGGCYGARDGSSSEGFTVWIDASELPDREIMDYGDGTKQELVNIFSLIENYGGELIEDLDGDVFSDACEDLGLKVSRNNTYNYAGHDAETPAFKVDADFAVIENEDAGGSVFLSIKFHCGGDIRGNYTDRVVYKFGSIDDLYGVLYPTCELLNQEEA